MLYFSKILNEHIAIDEEYNNLVSYSKTELKLLKGLDNDILRKVHLVKKIFNNSTIIDRRSYEQ